MPWTTNIKQTNVRVIWPIARIQIEVGSGWNWLRIASSYGACIWSVALYGSETRTLRKKEDRVINAFETWCWRTMLKIKWTDRITNDGVFQRAKEERLLLKFLKAIFLLLLFEKLHHSIFYLSILFLTFLSSSMFQMRLWPSLLFFFGSVFLIHKEQHSKYNLL